MTLSLMVYAVVVSALLTAGATLAQGLVRSSVPGTRFIWALAIAGSVAFLVAAPARLRAPVAPAPGMTSSVDPLATSLTLDLPMSLAERTAGVLPAWTSRALGAAWVLSSATLLALLALSYRRHRRRIAGASREVVDGTAVRVTETLGPAVVGVWRPAIVVPRWLLARAEEEQVMVVRHERSHVEVGDPALLLAGCAAAALMPWNPAAWYLLAKLRLAIEVDCDRRVLRAGARARAYGSLLIELTSALPAARVGAPAFACRPSHLERRLVAMTARPLTHRPVRMFAAAGIAALALLGACEAELPTAAEVEEMNVADVEERVMPALNLDPEKLTYYLNGKAVERELVLALAAEVIQNVEIARKEGSAQVHVSTEPSAAAESERRRTTEAAGVQKQPHVRLDRGSEPTVLLRGSIEATPAAKRPLLIIDGVITAESEMKHLNPSEIESVEVVKGAASRALYGERAVNGVIEVTSKKPLVREGTRFKRRIQLPTKEAGEKPALTVTDIDSSAARKPATAPSKKP